MVSLLRQHVFNLLLDKHLSKKADPHHLLLKNLTSKQFQKHKSFIIDFNNCPNGFFPSFDSLYKEIFSGFCLVDNFSDCFLFHTVNCRDKDVVKAHLQKLNKIIEDFYINSKTAIIISDVSIKNNVTASMLYVYSGQNILAKTIYHAVNVTSTKAELFTIRCGINQAAHFQDVHYIIVITDTIHSVRQIFDSSSHSY